MQELGYSFSLTTFAPSGKLWQIQHAITATARGRSSVGIQAKDGIVLVCQRKQDEASEVLVDQTTVKLMELVNAETGVTYSGLQADFRPVLSLAREIAVQYKATYGEEIPLQMLARRLAERFQEYTHEGGVRPFGIALMMAGLDQGKLSLYQIEPSGSYFKIKAWANGKENEKIRQNLEKRLGEGLCEGSLDDAVVAALGLMVENSDVELGPGDVVVGVQDGKEFRVLEKEVVEQYFKNLE